VTLNVEIAKRAAAYGSPGIAVDGNDLLAVWEVMRVAAERVRRGEGPTLIEAKTYRTVGHHEGDPVTGTYRTQAEVDAWTERCPIKSFRRRRIEDYEIRSATNLTRVDKEVDAAVAEAIEFARASPEADPATSADHVFAEPINPIEAMRGFGPYHRCRRADRSSRARSRCSACHRQSRCGNRKPLRGRPCGHCSAARHHGEHE
jgi:2-oxoisovalerate dehydrogenase E1 component